MRRNNRGKRIQLTGVCLLLLAFFVIAKLAGGISAKYRSEKTEEKETAAEQFYFTSDYLREEGARYTLSSDTKTLTIELRNYADALRWADSDITYSYTVTVNGTQSTNGKDRITHNASAGSTSQIEIQQMQAGTYTVTAVTEKPFVKTLSATFVVPTEEADIQTKVEDSPGSAYVLLTVSIKNYEGSIRIDWPGGLIPDTSQDILKNVVTWNGTSVSYDAGSVNLIVGKYASYTVRFFKADTAEDYSNSDKITVGTGQ